MLLPIFRQIERICCQLQYLSVDGKVITARQHALYSHCSTSVKALAYGTHEELMQ